MNAPLFPVHATALEATRYVANMKFERENEVMRKLMLAFGAAAMVAPTLVATTVDADAQRRYKYREWRGNDGRLRCRKPDGTTGLVVGAVAGGLLAAKKTAADAFTKYQVARNGEAIARMLFDPKALPDLRALAKSAPGTKNALAFTNRLLVLAGSSAAPRERLH